MREGEANMLVRFAWLVAAQRRAGDPGARGKSLDGTAAIGHGTVAPPQIFKFKLFYQITPKFM
jgi:hypothetical protein